MTFKWDKTLYAMFCLLVGAINIALSVLLSAELWAQILLGVSGSLIIILMILSFTFTKRRNLLNITSKSKALRSISDLSLKHSDTGLILYDKFNRIVFASEDLKEKGLNNVEGLEFTEIFKDISLEKFENIEEKVSNYNIAGRSYDVKFVPSMNGMLLTDKTEFDAHHTISVNTKIVIGLIKITSLNVKKFNVLSDTKTAYEVQSLINDWSIKYNAYFYNSSKDLDNDNWLFIMDFKNYRRAFIEDKNSLFVNLNKILEKNTDNLVVSIAIGFGGVTVDENGLLAEEAMMVAEESGSNQVVIKEQNKGLVKIQQGERVNTGLSRSNVSVFTTNLIRNVSKAKSIIILGHNYCDADSFSAVIAAYTVASHLNDNVRFYLGKMDETSSKIYDDILDSSISKKSISSEMALKRYIKSDTLIIVVDTTSAMQLPPKIIDDHDRNNLMFIDHHLISENSYKTTSRNFYVDVRASSTAEIMALIIDIVSSRTKGLKVSKNLAMMLLVGILIDTRSLTNGLSHYTFDAISLLSKWGAAVDKASKYSDIPINTFLDSNIILKTIQVIDKKVIIAIADDDYTVKDDISLAISGDRLMKVEGINASFIIARISKNKVKVSAREDGTYNISDIAEEIGGGGRENAAAAVIVDKDVFEVKDMLLNAIKKVGK